MVTRLYDDALAPLDLGASQYAILTKLDRLGPLYLQDLADALVMDRSTVGHLLRPLERRGLLTIETCSNDARKRSIGLSSAGRALALDARPLWASAQARFEGAFGAPEAEAMRATLERVLTTGSGRKRPAARRSQS